MPHYYQEKLAFVARLEKSGVLKNAAISAFRADCPFCKHNQSLIIQLHSATSASAYSCSACGEAGLTGEIEDNIHEKNPPEKKWRRPEKSKA
jgi:hypothetical protein